jgi:hypothetical protein
MMREHVYRRVMGYFNKAIVQSILCCWVGGGIDEETLSPLRTFICTYQDELTWTHPKQFGIGCLRMQVSMALMSTKTPRHLFNFVNKLRILPGIFGA